MKKVHESGSDDSHSKKIRGLMKQGAQNLLPTMNYIIQSSLVISLKSTEVFVLLSANKIYKSDRIVRLWAATKKVPIYCCLNGPSNSRFAS